MTAKDLKNALLQEAVQGKLVPPACRQAGKLQAKIPSAKDGQWFVYVIECEDGSFYKGFTTDLQKRYEQHCNGTGADWTKTHKPKQLYYWEIHYSEESALQREKYLKSGVGREWFKNEVVDKPENWSSARDLLEEIRRSRHSELVSESKSKTKKEKPLPEITEDEIPFDIPENWCWCKIKDIAYVSTGMTPLKSESKFYENGNIPWVTSTLTSSDYIDKADTYITEFALNTTSLDLYPKHTLILAMYGQGKTRGQISELLIPATINQACAAIELFSNEETLRKYMKLFHNWNYNNLRKEAAGSAQPNLNLNIIQNTIFPLPPLAEQKRIVATIEKFMPLIEEYGKKETELKAFNEQIGALTKKAILQEAVQGKLVPQIAAEGNAKDLLEEIKKEKAKLIKEGKIKKEKPLPEITEDEIPFEIPESWCWCRLGEIGDWKAGSTPSRSNPELYNGNIPWLKTGDLTDGDINEIPECISEKALESCSMRLNPIGSVLIAMYGATIGKLGILKIEATTNQACCACVPYNGIYNKYLFYYLMSQKKDFTEKAEGGAQPNISREKLVVHLIPLPPLAEQKRIVNAIEKLLPLCEKLGE